MTRDPGAVTRASASTLQSAPAAASAIAAWHTDLDKAAEWLDDLDGRIGLLSAGESVGEEAHHRLPVEVRLRRRRARILLRWVLLERHGVEAARGGFIELEEHGKPFLRGAPAFNVSHSGPICVVAVGGSGPVGVDVELPRVVQLGPERRALIVAAGEGLFSHGCATRGPAVTGGTPLPSAGPLPSAPTSKPGGGDDTSVFLAAWTRLEALAKARGDGVGRLLTALGITVAGARTVTAAEVTERARAIAVADGLAVVGLNLPGGAAGAVAGPVALVAQGVVCRVIDAADAPAVS